MYIAIGPLTFFFSNLPSEWLQSGTGRRLAAFISPLTDTSSTPFKLQMVDTVDHPSLQRFKKTGSTYHLNDAATARHFYITDAMKSVIDWNKREMRIQITHASTDPELDEMGKVLIQIRLLSSYLSISGRGIPLHCSAVYKDDAALVFFGTSGAGKSTIAHLMTNHGWNLLNDEYNLIMPAENTYRIFSTPFSRRATRCANQPGGIGIAGMFHLNHGDFFIETTTPEQQMKVLFESVYMFPDYSRFSNLLLENIDLIRSKTPVRKLHFSNNCITAELLEKHLEARI